MVESLAQGVRTARKSHRCFHCYRSIEPGQKYWFQTNKYDYVYTICWHLDCGNLASEYHKISDCDYDEGGYPPLRDEWCDNGEYFSECDAWRGFFPHVIARMELSDQLREAAP